MNNTTFTGFQCWKEERVIKVINKEALSIDRSNFLATHAPFSNIQYKRSPQEIVDKTEYGLSEEFKRQTRQNRHVFTIVQGIPGTGKSHLIRWLKERYEAENKEIQGNDVILLIERANCNLRGTLLQIIESGIFNQSSLQNYVQRLYDAATSLSSETLADTILDQIRNATSEVELSDEQLPRSFIRKRVKHFLQDIYVRQELKKEGGPIDRIKRYLSESKSAGLKWREMPGFEPNDFEFDLDTLRLIRDGGYKEARDLADRLHIQEEPEWRQELTTYFNRLLNYAIGRTTALSADDLKQIFNELRRQLQQQHRQLALFIEDITAFVGIDQGLIDVLATQHTGEGNREFCRLLSVIGITDDYYERHFPDNMRERITHHLKLNVQTRDASESELLNSSQATADLAARYLNAMRLTQEDLDGWVTQGAHPEQLPNKCDDCPFKTTCHDAFGAVDLSINAETPLTVGLYPFNERSLWNMYQRLKISKTPRSLLTSVLGYVLESHGAKISLGDFPPPSQEVGSDFDAPSLQTVAHKTMLAAQGKGDAARLESLILFWGTRSIHATNDGNRRFVGSLSQEVFQAFNLPFIEGEVTAATLGPTKIVNDLRLGSQYDYNIPEREQPPSQSASVAVVPITNATIQTATPAATSIVTAISLETREKYTEDINNWLNGKKLQNYEKLLSLLQTFISTAINWSVYSITPTQVLDRLNRKRMAIEDQVGSIRNPKDCFIFARSDKLAAVFQALDYISSQQKTFTLDKLGGHFTVLSSWLTQYEDEIIHFVRRPTMDATDIPPFTTLALINCVLLSCLQGTFETNRYSAQELFLLVLKDCVKSSSKQWEEATKQAENVRSKQWVDLMKNVKIHVQTCRASLLQALNRPQGGSSSVIIIDTNLALDIVEQFNATDWRLPAIAPIGASASDQWTAVYGVYRAIFDHFNLVLEEEQKQIGDDLQRLRGFISESNPKETFMQITNWVDTMRVHQKQHQLKPNSSVSAPKLSKILGNFEQTVNKTDLSSLALRLSGSLQIRREAKDHIQFFQDFESEVKKQLPQLQQSLNRLQEEEANSISTTQIEQSYEQTVQLLYAINNQGVII